MWSRKCNERGHILEEWIAERELVIINEGKTSTCVRAQGSSIVNIRDRDSSKGGERLGS